MQSQNSTLFSRAGIRSLLLFLVLATSLTRGMSQSATSYWSFVNPAPVGVHITDIAYVDNNVGYASCESGVIGRTTDAGRTWTFIQIPTKDFLTAIEFPSAKIGYITANGGKVFKTTDRGLSWTELTTPTTTNLNSLWFFDVNNGIIVGDAQGGSARIYKTTDGGATWTSLAAGFPVQNKHIRAIAFANESVGYVSGSAGLVAKTMDGGLTWTNISITTTNPAPVSASTNYVSQNYPGLGVVDEQNVIISSQNNTYVIKSSNGGTNWVIKIAQSGAPLNITGSVQMLNIAVKEDRAVICMGSALVGVSHDKGNSWSVRRVFPSSSYKAFQQFSAVTITPDNGVKLAGLYGLMADSVSGGSGWDTSYYKNINYHFTIQKQLFAVSHLDKNNILTSGGNGHIYRSSDGGATWVNRSIPEFSPPMYVPVGVNDIKYVATDAAYMACTNGYVYRSFDGADTWPDAYAFYTGRSNSAMDFMDKNTGWVCGATGASGSGAVFRTTDGGASWTMQNTTFTGATRLFGIDFVNNTTGWVVGTPQKIFKTTDGGINWTEQTAPAGVTGNLISVCFVNTDTGFACGGSGKVIRTTDGGATWTNVSPPGLALIANKVVFINSKEGMLFCAGGGAFKTTDGGDSWINFSAPTPDLFSGASIVAPYNSTLTIPSGTDVDIMVVGGRIIGGLTPSIFNLRAFTSTAVPPNPLIINVNNQCANAGPAKGKILNPPPYTQIDITVDGEPILYYPNDSSFVYFEPGTLAGGTHTVRVTYTSPGGVVFSEASFIFYAVNEKPQVTITSNDADNIICEGQSVTFTPVPVFGGTSPTYRWFVNSTQVATGPSYTYVPNLGDVVLVELKSSFACVSNPLAEYFIQPIDIPQFNPVITRSPANVLKVVSPDSPAGYQWLKDGQPIPGATGLSYTATQFGNYQVQEIYRTCTKLSNTLAIGPTAGDVQIFPVPAQTVIYIRTGSPSVQINQVIIFDAAGRQVMTKSFANSNLVEIDISRLPGGVYSARIEYGGQLVNKKFIVQ